MDTQGHLQPQHHREFLDRFVEACRADERAVAAFLGGSYGRGAADAYSDLDLYLVTSDGTHDDFFAGREAFVRRLGEVVFLETFGSAVTLFFIFADGTEGELRIGRESLLHQLHSGPYTVLLDRNGILAGAVFTEPGSDPAEQRETLRRQVVWFWHELSHFITAMGRGQYWWAYGQIEALRLVCVNLARLRHNFNDPDVGTEPFFKVERALPEEQLAPLLATICPMEPDAMLPAALVIVRFYQELAPPLARAHGIAYPAGLERVMLDRLEKLRAPR